MLLKAVDVYQIHLQVRLQVRLAVPIDRLVAVCKSATVNGEAESDVINQALPTPCMKVPIFEAVLAIHSALNSP